MHSRYCIEDYPTFKDIFGSLVSLPADACLGLRQIKLFGVAVKVVDLELAPLQFIRDSRNINQW